MPIYDYQCVDCAARDQRVAGLDDATAQCTCGGLMLRLDEDIFLPLFYEAEREEAIWENFRLGLVEDRRELEENTPCPAS